jgi:D-alanyl-D-alanine endopeptidase (penicillin-binding protein 7)
MILSIILTIALSSVYSLPSGTVQGANAPIMQKLPSAAARTGATLVRDAEPAPDATARAAGVWDPEAQRFVYEKNGTEQYSIASLTKLMTALVALDAEIDLNTTIQITRDDNDPEGSRIPIPNGGVVSVHDLLAATLIASANNAAEALVRATGITEAAFVGRMNERAASLGMTSTHFTDVTGLGPKNISTIRDLMRLADEAFAHPLIAELTRTASFNITNQDDGSHITLQNTNELLYQGLGVIAGKTGYTDAARGAFVSRIRGIGEHELLFVVLESDGRDSRFTDVHALADWAFANLTWEETDT